METDTASASPLASPGYAAGSTSGAVEVGSPSGRPVALRAGRAAPSCPCDSPHRLPETGRPRKFLTGTDRGATFDAAMKTVPPVPRPGCAGESLRVLAEESEMAKAI